MIDPAQLWLLAPLFFLVAALYASVGHGGASGYLALFALLGVTTAAAAPLALALNIVAAGIGFHNYRTAGHFSLPLLVPFIVTSVPFSYLGGLVAVDEAFVAPLLGTALLFAGIRLLVPAPAGVRNAPLLSAHRRWISGVIGALLGLLAGMVGIGGGVFLGPLLLFLGWADMKTTAATCAAFIVLNSVGGLLGHLSRGPLPWMPLAVLGGVVAAGAFAGSRLGASKLPPAKLRVPLAAVLLTAAVKLIIPLFW